METFHRLQQHILRSRRLPFLGIALTLLILGGTICLGTARLRERIRGQIAGRDATVLYSVALMQQLSQESDQELGGNLEEVPDQFAILLSISQLKGVIAARLFDPSGQFYAPFPPNVTNTTLSDRDLHTLNELKPIGRFLAQGNPAELFAATSSPLPQRAPLLEVLIPLHRKDHAKLLGIIQFIIDGESIAAEYTELDRGLFLQAGLAFATGGLLIAVGLSWAFRRLQRASGLLLERTQRLAQANQELALAAKTSAVGAISAHLIHGLSNPLSGLQDFVASRGQGTCDAEWDDAVTTASQMKNMIGEIVRIIGNEHGDERYEITLAEFMEMLSLRIRSVAEASGVHFETFVDGERAMPNREANLTLLILENLVKNALQATPRGKTVRCRVAVSDDRVAFEVEDQGPGFPEHSQKSLFKPCRSTKSGGNGIGLAICKQLASHLGADLELKRSGTEGCVFGLTLLHSKAVFASHSSLR